MKKIQLTQNKFALIDDTDFKLINKYKWHYHKAGYALRTCHKPRNGKKQETFKLYMHHAIMGKHKGMNVDHINGNKLDNQRSNLRICTHGENQMNSKKTNKPKSSIFKGVYWNKKDRAWFVRVAAKWVGMFKDEKQAAKAYNEKAKELFGEFALLNQV